MFLKLIGLGWIITTIWAFIFGGNLKLELKNPFSKKFETVIDITIER